MTIFAIILLIVLGLVLLLIEFAVIPGITVAGIGGFVLLALSVYIAFSEYGNGIGFCYPRICTDCSANAHVLFL